MAKFNEYNQHVRPDEMKGFIVHALQLCRTGRV